MEDQRNLRWQYISHMEDKAPTIYRWKYEVIVKVSRNEKMKCLLLTRGTYLNTCSREMWRSAGRKKTSIIPIMYCESDNESNASEEGCIMDSLFTCEEYVLRSWSFPIHTENPAVASSSSSAAAAAHGSSIRQIEQKLLCSNQNSTDHDLTGQIVWPASTMLCYFIAKNHATIFQDANVLELGAGNKSV